MKYVVPDELFMSQDIVLEQLAILEKLFPIDSEPAKKIKLDDQKTPKRRDSSVASTSGDSSIKHESVSKQKEPDTVIDLLNSPEKVTLLSSTKTPVKPSKITDFWQSPRIDVNRKVKDEITKSPIKNKPIIKTAGVDLLESPEKQRTKTASPSIMRTPKISALQLKESLKATLEKVSANQNAVRSPSTDSTSQADQLAAYRSRHIQNRTTNSNSSVTGNNAGPQQAISSANYRKPSEVPGPSSSSTTPRQPPRNIRDYISVVNPRGQMAAKLKAAAPYNFFLTTITASKATHSEPLSITFQGKLLLLKYKLL